MPEGIEGPELEEEASILLSNRELVECRACERGGGDRLTSRGNGEHWDNVAVQKTLAEELEESKLER
jgi:hypothetical protein